MKKKLAERETWTVAVTFLVLRSVFLNISNLMSEVVVMDASCLKKWKLLRDGGGAAVYSQQVSDISSFRNVFYCMWFKKMTTWQFEKQFVNKLSLLRIILQRKGRAGVLFSLLIKLQRCDENKNFQEERGGANRRFHFISHVIKTSLKSNKAKQSQRKNKMLQKDKVLVSLGGGCCAPPHLSCDGPFLKSCRDEASLQETETCFQLLEGPSLRWWVRGQGSPVCVTKPCGNVAFTITLKT